MDVMFLALLLIGLIAVAMVVGGFAVLIFRIIKIIRS